LRTATGFTEPVREKTALPQAFFSALYQHVALDGDLEMKYQEAMKKVDF
jgi:hypothetical protein